MTGPTRPTSEQLRLVSSKTGEHILDTYLEASEKGNRTLPDLLDDLFNSSGSFYRGSGFYNWKGDYTNGTPYITGDTFKSAATGSIYVALRNFTASNNLSQEVTDAKISLVFDGASILAAQTSATNAANSATAAATSATSAASSASTATTQATNASTSAAAASGSATAASTSATAAAGSATAAANSASAAASSASAASSSQSAASTSATNAATSATAAAASQSTASTAAAASQTSATNSAGSASTAAGHASTAATQATNAANSATTAATQASTATTQATNAASSASTAATQATSASTSASNAATSATNAANSATAASNSATTASTQATTATTQAANAASSASSAATQATNAATSATNAAASATTATTEATNAAASATSAASSLASTLAAFDSFDDRYLGAKTADPTVDNDGNALLAGSLYFNSVTGAMKVYTGSVWAAAYVNGADYVAKAGDTMSGALTINANLTVDTDTFFVDATNNRVGIGTATPSTKAEILGSTPVAAQFFSDPVSGTTLNVTTLISGALAVGQYLASAYGRVRITALGTGTGGVGTYTIDTDQTGLTFTRSYADAPVTMRLGNSETVWDRNIPYGTVEFGGAITNTGPRGYIQTQASASASTTSIGSMLFGVGQTNGASPPRTALILNPINASFSGSMSLGNSFLSPRNLSIAPATISLSGRSQSIYASGASLSLLTFSANYIDASVETSANYGQLGYLVDSSITSGQLPSNFYISTRNASGTLAERFRITKDGNVGIGTTNPSERLEVAGTVKASSVSASNVNLVSGSATDYSWLRLQQSSTESRIESTIVGTAAQTPMVFYIAGTERFRIDTSGNVGIGTSSPSAPLHVVTSTLSTGIIIDSTDDTATSGPSLVLRRSSPSPAANDYVGQIFFQGLDSTGVATNYARILARIEDPTNPSENGSLYFHTALSGSSTTAAIMNSAGDFTATGNVTAYSDARLKTNVRTIPDALAMVQQMRGVFFDKNGEPSVGVIAQEMEEVLPEVVHEGEYKSVAYGNIVGVLIEAMKEQQRQIDELTRRLADK